MGFTSGGAFLPNFAGIYSSKLLIESKKVRVTKVVGYLYHHGEYGGKTVMQLGNCDSFCFLHISPSCF